MSARSKSRYGGNTGSALRYATPLRRLVTARLRLPAARRCSRRSSLSRFHWTRSRATRAAPHPQQSNNLLVTGLLKIPVEISHRDEVFRHL
jgi:hypothetical protein